MEYPPRKHVEQFEVIERSVVESRRPINSIEALSYQPTSTVRTQTERFETTDSGGGGAAPFDISHISSRVDDPSDRYYLTGEREKDVSVLYNSTLSPPVAHSSSLHDASYNNSVGINNYGYDLHEIQTSDGGARVVQTHGSGHLFPPPGSSVPLATEDEDSGSLVMHDRSGSTTLANTTAGSGQLVPPQPPLDGSNLTAYRESHSKEVDYRRTVSGGPSQPDVAMISGGFGDLNKSMSPGQQQQTHSILKNSDSWKKYSSEDNSLVRKDSYKRMQESQLENSFYSSSNAGTMQSKGSQRQWLFSGGGDASTRRRHAGEGSGGVGKGCGAVKKFFVETFDEVRDARWTPRLVGTVLLIGLLLLLLLLIVWLIVSSLLSTHSARSFLMYPPVCEECVKRNPSAAVYRAPSELFVHLSSPAQVHFELNGNAPFKSNSFTAVDFDTGFIAIADHALTDESGRHTTCFMMELDQSALPNRRVLVDALDNTPRSVRTQFGWQEYWQYNAEPIDEAYARSKFTDTIDDCVGVKWYFLRHTVYTKDSSCASCYDFCLPDYAVLKHQRYEDEPSLSVRRLNCFRLYVPEWSRFTIQTDETGGHWQYPRLSSQLSQQKQQPPQQEWSQPQRRDDQHQLRQQYDERQQKRNLPPTIQELEKQRADDREREAWEQWKRGESVGAWIAAGRGLRPPSQQQQ